MSFSCDHLTDEILSSYIFVLEDNNKIGTLVIDTDNIIQAKNDQEIIRISSFIANVATRSLLKSQSNGIDKFDVLVKLKNFKVKQVNYKFVKYLADILKQLFPEKLNTATLVDPSQIFVTGWDIVRTFLDPPTRKKMKFISTLGKDYSHLNDD